MSNLKSILENYDIYYSQNEIFRSKIHHLISDLLESKDIKVHNITSRVKNRGSLEKKISVKNKYNQIGEITDLIGIRVITFFEDEVDVIANLISEEFEIDSSNSVDKRILEYNKFGYLSLHFVAGLNSERCKLLEYKTFKEFKFEIQIRSILQHAWAEIEHDIGYKSKNGIPDQLKRNFSRIAALLEISDLEFTKLRGAITNYEGQIESEISQNPTSVDLNGISLESLIQNNEFIISLDNEISELTRIRLSDDIDVSEIHKLQYLGISNIEQLLMMLEEKKKKILLFVEEFSKTFVDDDGWFDRGISLFYLSYIMILDGQKDGELDVFIKKFFKNALPNLKDRVEEAYKIVMSKL